MPLFDEEATAKLSALIDHGARTQRQIDALGVKIDALYAVVLKTHENLELVIEDQKHHRDNPDAHN